MAKIYARRIQRGYRNYRDERRRRSSLVGYSSEAIIRLIRSRDQLFNQAKICLDNKKLSDRARSNSSGYLLRTHDQPRRSLAPSQYLNDPNE